MARDGITFDDLIAIARRTGVENWVDPATGKRGQIIAAPSSWRGKRGSMGTVVGVTRHHTGTEETFKPAEDYPTYQVVKEGRAGLDNSLSAFGLGRWYGIYVFSEFLSWHAGTWLWDGITDGNGHFLGTEAEGTGARWTAFQQEFYPRLTAAELLFLGEGIDMMPRHADGATPAGRKDDAKNLPADFTAKVAGYLANPSTLTYGARPVSPQPAPPEEADMFIVRVGEVPHMLVGDRYFKLDSWATARQFEAAGVKRITVGQAAHATFVANLRAETAPSSLPAS